MESLNEDIKRRYYLANFLCKKVEELVDEYNSERGQAMTIIECTMYVEAMSKLKDIQRTLRINNI